MQHDQGLKWTSAITPRWHYFKNGTTNNLKACRNSASGIRCHLIWDHWFFLKHDILCHFACLYTAEFKAIIRSHNHHEWKTMHWEVLTKNTHQKCFNMFPTEHMCITFISRQPLSTEQTQKCHFCGTTTAETHLMHDQKLLTYNNEV